MKSWKWIAVLLLGAALSVSGCGGDDDDDGAKQDNGKAGSGSDMEKDAGTGSQMQLPMGAVACGAETCMPPEGSPVASCCFDPFASKCGMMQGMSCVALVEMDPRCPSVVVAGGMFTLASCCTEDNMCGINTSMFGGSPCTELGQAAMDAMMRGGGGFVMFPAPKACE